MLARLDKVFRHLWIIAGFMVLAGTVLAFVFPTIPYRLIVALAMATLFWGVIEWLTPGFMTWSGILLHNEVEAGGDGGGGGDGGD